jgi:hypothetical protein
MHHITRQLTARVFMKLNPGGIGTKIMTKKVTLI